MVKFLLYILGASLLVAFGWFLANVARIGSEIEDDYEDEIAKRN
jgi:hypothetical protein